MLAFLKPALPGIAAVLIWKVLEGVAATAQEATAKYVRYLAAERLRRSAKLLVIQAALLALIEGLVWVTDGALPIRLAGSATIVLMLAYNLGHFAFITVPELFTVVRRLRGMRGFLLRNVLKVSVVKVLVELDVVFAAVLLTACFLLRTGVATAFDIFLPWRELLR
jgi:hypothetical protein